MSGSPPPLIRDILDHIVLLSSQVPTLGPPQNLHSLLLTCRAFHSMLAVEPSPGLYAQIFDSQFDIAAPKRRLDPDAFSSSSRQLEMKRRFTAMQLFKRGDVYVGGDDERLVEAFGVAYIMLLEDDGTNAGKLKGAGLVGFVEEWLEKRLCESEGGWPVDNEISALALNIFWQLTDKGVWRCLCSWLWWRFRVDAMLTGSSFRYGLCRGQRSS